MAKPDPLERVGYGRVVEASGRRGIAHAGAQTAERQVGPLWHVNHGVTRWQVDSAGARGPQARDRTEQGALVRTVLDDDLDVLARGDLDPRLFERCPAIGQSEAEVLQHKAFGLRCGHRDPTRIPGGRIRRSQGIAQRRDAQECGAPVGDLREVVDKPAQRLLNLVESADHDDQPAEGQAAAEVARGRDQDRRDEGEPAVTRGHPGQPSHAASQVQHDSRDAIDRAIEDLSLLQFAAMDNINPFIREFPQGRAQSRLRVKERTRFAGGAAREMACSAGGGRDRLNGLG